MLFIAGFFFFFLLSETNSIHCNCQTIFTLIVTDGVRFAAGFKLAANT